MAVMMLLWTMLAASAAAPQDAVPTPTVTSSPEGQASESVVPRLINFSGTIKDRLGKLQSGALNLTFSLYEEQDGGSPLWVETQKVELDEQGHYTVLLGSTSPEGLPLDLFTSGKARWLGVQPELPGESEQPRILLVGMPYALKAADADTLGGKPVSAFVTAESLNSPASGSAAAAAPLGTRQGTKSSGVDGQNGKQAPLAAVTGGGTTNYVPLWTSSTNLGNSLIYQSGSNIGIGTTRPSYPLHLPAGKALRIEGGTSATDRADYFSFGGNGTFGVDAPGVPNGRFVVQNSGNVGINNPNPSTTLDIINKVAGASAVNVQATAINSVGVNATGDRIGVSGTSLNGNVGVAGTASGVCAVEVCSPIGVSGSATGAGVGVFGSSDVNIGVQGSAWSTSAGTFGVSGSVRSPSGVGVEGTGPNTGMEGIATSAAFFAAGVFGHATAGSGLTRGVYGVSESPSGIGVHGIAATGGQFETGSGNEIIGRGFGTTNFRVDATGKGFFDGGTQNFGADFAESMAVAGDHDRYHPGDLLRVDPKSDRRLRLTDKPYSTLVAGIYSTKPGMLASPHHMDDPTLANEVPLAVVGIVPCKVSTENGPIQRGDLLVSSSIPGYAMKGTDRRRMLGAVVGKALEPLASGKGVIEVLVTLQ
jgi:hypothetical protein